MKKFFVLALLLSLLAGLVGAQSSPTVIFGDARPDAPELAPRGDYGVGVQTLTVTNPDQIDILSFSADNPEPRYDRTLTLEVWYPAEIPDGVEPLVVYGDTLGRADNPNDPLMPFSFGGRALRDAQPLADENAPYPLIVVSHGFPGSRFMMSYLTENLASKGYVVVAIDHTESTFGDVSGFASTLLNRSLDILFVIDAMAEFSAGDGFLAGMVDVDNTGVVGYSMGGYGALNAAGGAYGSLYIPVLSQFGIPGVELLAVRTAGNEAFTSDPRIRAVFAFAPWGMNFNLWDEASLAGLQVPVFYVVGDQDDISGYRNGVRRLFELSTNTDRYLLTLEGARHNVAVNPAPAEAMRYEQFMRYSDSVWDSARMNNIMQHFATAFFGVHLSGLPLEGYYNGLIEVAADGVYDANANGFGDNHTYWLGFQPRSAVGMRLEFRVAGE